MVIGPLVSLVGLLRKCGGSEFELADALLPPFATRTWEGTLTFDFGVVLPFAWLAMPFGECGSGA